MQINCISTIKYHILISQINQAMYKNQIKPGNSKLNATPIVFSYIWFAGYVSQYNKSCWIEIIAKIE